MAIGRRKPEQQTMCVNQQQLSKGKEYPFYCRLNGLLAKDGFDSWAEETRDKDAFGRLQQLFRPRDEVPSRVKLSALH